MAAEMKPAGSVPSDDNIKDIAELELEAIESVLEIERSEPITLDADFVFALEVGLELEEKLAAVEDKIIASLNLNGDGILARETWRIFSAEWHASGKSLVAFLTTTTEVLLASYGAALDRGEPTTSPTPPVDDNQEDDKTSLDKNSLF